MTHAQKMKLANEHIRLQDAFRKAKTRRGQDAALAKLEALKRKYSARKSNPTKAQKREKTRKVSARRRIAVALQNFVRKANPAAKGVVKATKVKGGWNVRVVDVRRSK